MSPANTGKSYNNNNHNNDNHSDERPRPIRVNQDAKVFASLLSKGEAVQYDVERGRQAYLHLATPSAGHSGGHLVINGEVSLAPGDGLFIKQQTHIHIEGSSDGLAAEFLLFDLADAKKGGTPSLWRRN